MRRLVGVAIAAAASAPGVSGTLRTQEPTAGRPAAAASPVTDTTSDTTATHGPVFYAVRAVDGEHVDARTAPALQRRISLTLIGIPLGMAVEAIADRAGLETTFSPETIPLGARVSMHADDVTVAAALRWVLVNARVDVLVQDDGHLTLVPRSTQGAVADSSGVLAGTLIDGDDAQPVPYGTVTLLGTDVARFTDRSGRFRIARLPASAYKLRARQIGYAPVDTTVAVAAGSSSTVTIRMHRVPALLRLVRVQGRRPKACVATGVPDSTVNPTLAAVFAQVRENVDRYTLLLDKYPFRYTHEERQVLRGNPGGDSTEFVDTLTYDSRDRRPYQVGGVIYRAATLRAFPVVDSTLAQADTGQQPVVRMEARVQQRRHMYIPTFADLAQPAFLAAHCFDYGGTSRAKGRDVPTLIRVDFRPASSIKVPDVSGSIYLDADSLVVRRAVFELTKPEAADPPILGFKVTTTFRELLPLVPMIDSFRSEQPLLSPFAARFGSVVRTALGSDRLIGFEFESLTPGEQQGSPAAAVAAATPPAPGDTARRAQPLAPVGSPYVTRVHPVLPADEACTLPPAVDTISVLLYATIYGQRPKHLPDTAWSHYESGVLGALSQSFDLPDDLPLAAFSWPFEYTVYKEAPRDDRLSAATVTPRERQAMVTPPTDSSSPRPGTLVGVLLDEDGHAVPSAAVSLAGTTDLRQTDASGVWRMDHLFSGAYVVRVRRTGYVPLDAPVFVRGGPGVTQDTIRVTRAAEHLAVVTVKGHDTGPFVVPMMSTVVRMTLGADGSLRSAAIAASSASGVADTAVLTAVRRAVIGHPWSRIASGVRGAAGTTLDLVVSMGEPPPGDQTTIVRRLDAPTWPSRGTAQMEYQPSLSGELSEGDPLADPVALEFVVNEHGRPLPWTARPDYARSTTRRGGETALVVRRLIQSLPGFRFNEAYVSGCAVPEFIRQGFSYEQSWSGP
jgi:Carboxypeptidase regulatory-like domain